MVAIIESEEEKDSNTFWIKTAAKPYAFVQTYLSGYPAITWALTSTVISSTALRKGSQKFRLPPCDRHCALTPWWWSSELAMKLLSFLWHPVCQWTTLRWRSRLICGGRLLAKGATRDWRCLGNRGRRLCSQVLLCRGLGRETSRSLINFFTKLSMYLCMGSEWKSTFIRHPTESCPVRIGQLT